MHVLLSFLCTVCKIDCLVWKCCISVCTDRHMYAVGPYLFYVSEYIIIIMLRHTFCRIIAIIAHNWNVHVAVGKRKDKTRSCDPNSISSPTPYNLLSLPSCAHLHNVKPRVKHKVVILHLHHIEFPHTKCQHHTWFEDYIPCTY